MRHVDEKNTGKKSHCSSFVEIEMPWYLQWSKDIIVPHLYVGVLLKVQGPLIDCLTFTLKVMYHILQFGYLLTYSRTHSTPGTYHIFRNCNEAKTTQCVKIICLNFISCSGHFVKQLCQVLGLLNDAVCSTNYVCQSSENLKLLPVNLVQTGSVQHSHFSTYSCLPYQVHVSDPSWCPTVPTAEKSTVLIFFLHLLRFCLTHPFT